MNTNDSCETRNSGSAPPELSHQPQPSRPTEEDGAPSLGAPDRNPRETVPGVRRAFAPAQDQIRHAAWRAFGSDR